MPLSECERSHWASDNCHSLFIDLSGWSSNGCIAALKLHHGWQGKFFKCTDCESELTVTHTDINHSSYAVCLSCLLNRFNVYWRVEHRNILKENPVKSEIQQLCDLFHWIYSSGMWSFTKKMNSRAKVWDFYFRCCPVITKIMYKNMPVYQLQILLLKLI